MATETFQYECTACGKCCSWGGWVCLNIEDTKRLAEFKKTTVQDFVDSYTVHIAVEYGQGDEMTVVPYLALKNTKDSCIFLEGKLCAVHEAKPVHCAYSPLLAEFLLDEEGWTKFSEFCEGVGEGPVITRPEIDEALKQQAERDVRYEKQLEEFDWDLGKLLGITLHEAEVIPDMGLEIDIEFED